MPLWLVRMQLKPTVWVRNASIHIGGRGRKVELVRVQRGLTAVVLQRAPGRLYEYGTARGLREEGMTQGMSVRLSRRDVLFGYAIEYDIPSLPREFAIDAQDLNAAIDEYRVDEANGIDGLTDKPSHRFVGAECLRKRSNLPSKDLAKPKFFEVIIVPLTVNLSQDDLFLRASCLLQNQVDFLATLPILPVLLEN